MASRIRIYYGQQDCGEGVGDGEKRSFGVGVTREGRMVGFLLLGHLLMAGSLFL